MTKRTRGEATVEREILPRDFFQRDPFTCARELIGCRVVWDGCEGIVVETEAYASSGDEACHTFRRKGAREFVEAHSAGAAYVYFNYGMHWLANVLVKGSSDGFVLIRALEPTGGLEKMRRRRGKQDARQLCSGPGKLTQALGITGTHHGLDLCCHPNRSFRKAEGSLEVVTDHRIGISLATELKWRFLLKNSTHVSAPVREGRRQRQ